MSTREAVKEADEETVTEIGDKVSLPHRIARRAGRIPVGWRVATVTVLTLLVAGSGVVAGILDTQTSNNTSTQEERDAAVADLSEGLSPPSMPLLGRRGGRGGGGRAEQFDGQRWVAQRRGLVP